MGLWLRQSTAVIVKVGPFIDDTDGKTAETALTVTQADIRLSKNGANIAQKNEANNATTDELGYYDCPLDATDTNTLGILQLFVHEAGALPVFHEYMVVEEQVWDSFFGADKLDVNTAELANIDFGATMKVSLETAVDAGLDNAIPAVNTATSVNDILLDVVTLANVNTEVDNALNTAIPAVNTATSVNDVLLDVLTLASVADAVHDEAVEGAYTSRELMRLMSAILAGKLSGAGTGTLTFRDINDSANRQVATVDATNNRTAVVHTV